MLLHNFIQCIFMITPAQCCLSHSFQHTSYISKDNSDYQKFKHYTKSKYYHFTNTNKYLNVKEACGISCFNFCKLSSKQNLKNIRYCKSFFSCQNGLNGQNELYVHVTELKG